MSVGRPRGKLAPQHPFLVQLFAEQDRRGWTNVDLSKRSGIDDTTISLLRRGNRRPSLLPVECIAEALGFRLVLAPFHDQKGPKK